eukprot:901245_1
MADTLRKRNQYVDITTPHAFKQFFREDYSEQFVINVGKRPKQTEIGMITRNGQSIEFSTTTMQNDADHYEYEYELKDEKNTRVSGKAKRAKQMLRIDGLEADKRYSVRIQVFNGVATSPLTEWKRIDVDRDPGGPGRPIVPANGPQDKVLSHDMKHHILWYFTDTVLDQDGGSYYSCKILSDTQKREFPMTLFLSSKKPTLGGYYVILDRDLEYNAKWLYIKMFSNKRSRNKPVVEEMKHKSKLGTHTANQEHTYLGFRFPKSDLVHIIDAVSNAFSLPFSNKKDAYYLKIAKSFTMQLFRETNEAAISPYVCVRTIPALWAYIADHMKYETQSNPMKTLKEVLNGRVTAPQIQNMNNWKDASEVLSAVGGIMMIEGSQAIDGNILRNVFARITDPKVYGSMKGILKNIGLIFEHWVDFHLWHT